MGTCVRYFDEFAARRVYAYMQSRTISTNLRPSECNRAATCIHSLVHMYGLSNKVAAGTRALDSLSLASDYTSAISRPGQGASTDKSVDSPGSGTNYGASRHRRSTKTNPPKQGKISADHFR